MIKYFNGNIFDSKANFIVHQVNCKGVMNFGVAAQVAERYSYVEREYLKYLRYCKKNKINPLGTVQYVPTEVWAIGLVDTMKNNYVDAYDKEYQYIVNLFGQYNYGMGVQQTNLKAMKAAFIDICEKAKSVGATVAVPYRIGSFRGGAKWSDVERIIKNVFEHSEIDVEIWRCDKR